ncbi:hypothetical protein TrST_g13560, partial [Triparma strigata]
VEMDTKVQTSFVVAQWSPVVDMIDATITGDDVADEDTAATFIISDIELIDSDGSEHMSLYLVARNPSAGSSAIESVEVNGFVASGAPAVLIDGDLVVQGEGGEYLLDTDAPEDASFDFTDYSVYELPSSLPKDPSVSILPVPHFSGQVNLLLVAVVTDGPVSETSVKPFQIEFMPVADDFTLFVANMTE